MKYLFIILFFLTTLKATAQREPNRGYGGLMIHDLDQLGASFVYSFGVSKYLGVGAGIEATSYLFNTLVPIYTDIRFRHKIGKIEPFIGAQAGFPIYNGKALMSDGVTQRGNENVTGEFMYGGVAGIGYLIGKAGIFASYNYRGYMLRYFDRITNPGGYRETVYASTITLGVCF